MVTDPADRELLDTLLAARVSGYSALPARVLPEQIDYLVALVDELAVRRRRDNDADRSVDIEARPDGLADLWGKVRTPDGVALIARLDVLADSVCRDDPRTKAQRRADATGALAVGADHLACLCGNEHCPAAASGSSTPVTVPVIAEQSSVEGASENPALIPGHGPIPTATLRAMIAAGARTRTLLQPDPAAPAEPGYRPSTALAAFVRARDLCCTFPGCDVPADRCDIDHTKPWPYGSTHASNLTARCRHHHLLKTFWTGPDGWTDTQHPDGTIVWTSPTGHVYITRPAGAALFPQLGTPTGISPSTPMPPPAPDRGLCMPTRRRTRKQERASRIAYERELNLRDELANPPPY